MARHAAEVLPGVPTIGSARGPNDQRVWQLRTIVFFGRRSLLRYERDLSCCVAVADREPYRCAGPDEELVEYLLDSQVTDLSAIHRKDPVAPL